MIECAETPGVTGMFASFLMNECPGDMLSMLVGIRVTSPLPPADPSAVTLEPARTTLLGGSLSVLVMFASRRRRPSRLR
jgi:hypothetical protein